MKKQYTNETMVSDRCNWFRVFSYQKEIRLSSEISEISNEAFFGSVKTGLKDSLAKNDFSTIDETRWYKSKDAQSNSYFVRIAIQSKTIATDFILLRTDSLGVIKEGKIIHADKDNDVLNHRIMKRIKSLPQINNH